MPESLKSTFDATYDFGKPLREVIENFLGMSQEAISRLFDIIRWLLIVLITIDLAMGASAEEAMQAISNPMDIVSKGANIVAPIYNELFKIHGVWNLATKALLWLPSLFFAVILIGCFFLMSAQITLAYLEFYFMVVAGFTTFFFSRLFQYPYGLSWIVNWRSNKKIST